MSNTNQQPTEFELLVSQIQGMAAGCQTPSFKRGVLNGAVQELRRLHAENEALSAANTYLHGLHREWSNRAINLRDRVDELESQMEAIGAGGVGTMSAPTLGHHGNANSDKDLQRKTASSATSCSIVPPGWKLVPVQLTQDMVGAFTDASPLDGPSWSDASAAARQDAMLHFHPCYLAMLAAAPQPPKVEQEPVAWQDTANASEVVPADLWDNIDPAWRGMYRPLYTHPQPKRDPLTKAEIYSLEVHLMMTITEVVRVVERAHGIGGGE